MSDIERYVALVLCNQDNFTTQSVSNASLLENVGIPPRHIANNNSRAIDERNYILDYAVMIPNIISPLTDHPGCSGGCVDR